MPNNDDENLELPQKSQHQAQPEMDKARIMYNALVEIAHSEAFFDSEKRLVKIAQKAIQKVTGV